MKVIYDATLPLKVSVSICHLTAAGSPVVLGVGQFMTQLKITGVSAIPILDRNLFVRIDTDAGLTGWGECSPISIRATAALVESAAPLLLGADASDIGPLWQKLFTALFKAGHGGLVAYAISGIDIALHDLYGKALGQPIYKLLGGAFRMEVELIGSLWRLDLPIEQEVERVLGAVAAGYRSVKLHLDKRWGFDAEPRRTVELMTAVRRAVGNDVNLLADMNNAYTLSTALYVGKAFEELGLVHFEEPLPPYDYDSYRALQRALRIPVASGEQEYSTWQFQNLAERGEVQILMPDVIKTYGLTETRRIADLALRMNRPIVCHNAYPTINTAAHLHFWASSKMCFRPQEYPVDADPLRDQYDLFPGMPTPQSGRLHVPSRPGLGLEPDLALMERLRS
jgi:L-alanine-DL-glutamate epimerase-like enolase superfamily enzyme